MKKFVGRLMFGENLDDFTTIEIDCFVKKSFVRIVFTIDFDETLTDRKRNETESRKLSSVNKRRSILSNFYVDECRTDTQRESCGGYTDIRNVDSLLPQVHVFILLYLF